MSSVAEPKRWQEEWTSQRDFSERDKLIAEFQTYTAPIKASLMKNITQEGQRELEGALYPDIEDTTFLSKLLRKREFRETRQTKITDTSLKDNVCDVQEFEYTAVQKFVAQFMSPDTPYNGMLLYHGVGVGKTASAILNVSYALDNNLCQKPIFIVPNPTYEKWKKEMFGGMTKLYIVDYIENEKNLELSFEDEAKAKKFAKAVDGKIKEKGTHHELIALEGSYYSLVKNQLQLEKMDD